MYPVAVFGRINTAYAQYRQDSPPGDVSIEATT